MKHSIGLLTAIRIALLLLAMVCVVTAHDEHSWPQSFVAVALLLGYEITGCFSRHRCSKP